MNALQQYLLSSVSPTGVVSFCPTDYDTAAAACKTLIVVPYNATAVPPSTTLNTVVDINSLSYALSYFGANTLAYRLLATALCSCTNGLSSVQVLALPLLAGAVSTVYDITIAGPAITDHTKTISLLGKDYTVFVATGSTAANIAALFQAAMANDPALPFTVAVSAGGLTLTANDPGDFLNDLFITVTDSRAGVAIVDTVITMAQTVTGAGALDTTGFIAAVGQCPPSFVAISDQTQATVAAIQNWIASVGSCGPDYAGVMGYFARKQTVGAALAFGNGVPGVSSAYNEVIVGLQVSPLIPYSAAEIAVARAVKTACVSCQDPGNPVSNDASEMTCLPYASSCAGMYTRQNMNDLFTAGWTIISPINGYLGVEEERTFHRWDAAGTPTIAYSDPTQIRIAQWFYSTQLKPWLMDNYGSVQLFKNGTTPVLNAAAAGGVNAPAFIQNASATTPNLFKGALVAFMQRFIGLIFDQQDFTQSVFAYTDDQLRALCQGDPRVLVVFFNKVSISRPLRQFNLSFNYTTRTC